MNCPSADQSLEQLRQLGWLVSDLMISGEDGPHWLVIGHRGDRSIQAEGPSRDQAWWQALQQVQAIPPPAPAPPVPGEAPRSDRTSGGSPDELLRFEGARYWVESVAVSPDGGRVATGSGQPLQPEKEEADFSVRLWDLRSGKELQRFLGHKHWVMSVAFSPDGRRILSGSYDNTVRLWEVDGGKLLHVFRGHTERVRSVAYAPDGRHALSGSYDKTMRLWDVAAGRQVHCFQGHTHWVMSVALSADSRRALSSGFDQSVRLWDVEVETEARRGLAGGLFHHIWRLWGGRSRRELARLLGHSNNVTTVAFSPDCRRALSGSIDKTVRLWDLATRREVRRFEGHSRGVMSVAFSPGGRRVLSGGMDNRVFLWDVETGQPLYRHEGHTDVVTSVAFTPDGRQALTGSADKTVRLWRLPE
jgi:WD40 repeat protein